MRDGRVRRLRRQHLDPSCPLITMIRVVPADVFLKLEFCIKTLKRIPWETNTHHEGKAWIISKLKSQWINYLGHIGASYTDPLL